MSFARPLYIRRAILKTLIYASIFDFPLKKEEIWQRLITDKRISFKEICFWLDRLVKKGVIRKENQYYWPEFLPFPETLSSKKIILEKQRLAQKTANFLKIFPWIKLVAATGSLGAENISPNDDIDLLILTQSKRLWLTRLVVQSTLLIFGRFLGICLRRPNDSLVKDKICLNLFLTTDSLKIPRESRNLFVAYELMLLKPLFDKGNFYYALIAKNKFWLKKYLVNWFKDNRRQDIKGQLEFNDSFFLNILEAIAFWIQKKYMSQRKTREKIAKNFAFFHPINKGKRYLRLYKKLLDKSDFGE